jgi:hypothetical protein
VPSGLPTETSYQWAGDVASETLRYNNRPESGVHAIRRYLSSSFGVEPDSPVTGAWAVRLASSGEPLVLLFADIWGQGRVGIFGEPEWLTRHPRIVPRGIAMLRGVFGQAVPSPPAGVTATFADSDPGGLSGRERIEKHGIDPICRGCHDPIDPLGISLEHFDQGGAYRELDAGRPVDSSGTYAVFDNETFTFTSIEELGPQLAQSCRARLTFADLNLKQALLDANLLLDGEDLTLAHEDDVTRVRQAFVNDQSYPALVRAIAQTSAFLR